MADPWIFNAKPNPSARVRLFCFPHAGVGAAVFRGWSDALPATVEVCGIQPPGRGTRLRETPLNRLGPIARAAAGAIAGLSDLPFAVFGHSLGALVGFEAVRELRRLGAPAPLHLFLSSRRAPHLPEPDAPLHRLADAAFVGEVRRRYDGIPEAVRREPELMELMLPALRADIEALETYAYSPEDPLGCPLSAFGGEADARVSREDLAGWREHTRGAFESCLFPGGHFYLETSRAPLVQALSRGLGLGLPAPVEVAHP